MKDLKVKKVFNEEGKPFQGLEERVFARYISDMLSRYTEVSDITSEAWPELVGEIKLLRSSIGKISSSLEELVRLIGAKVDTDRERPADTVAPTIISLDVSEDLKVSLAVRDALFQAALNVEDVNMGKQNDLSIDTLEDGAYDTETPLNNAHKSSLAERQSIHIAKRYPKPIRGRVSEIFNEFHALNAEEQEPITKYLDIRKKYPKVVYYLYGRARIWGGTAAFLAAYNEWCNQ